MTTPKPAPTSAPTEQDRERAQEIVLSVEHALGHEVNARHELVDPIAAALQAERERTRAEGDDAVIVELKQLAKWIRDPNSVINREDANDEIARAVENRIRALEQAAQLPQGETK